MKRLVIDAGVLSDFGASTKHLGNFARMKKVMATTQYMMKHLNSVSNQIKSYVVVEGSEEALQRVTEVLKQVEIGYRIEETGED